MAISRAYKFFVWSVPLRMIVSGWENREDAKDDVDNEPQGWAPFKVLTSRFLEGQGVDPYDTSFWVTEGRRRSEGLPRGKNRSNPERFVLGKGWEDSEDDDEEGLGPLQRLPGSHCEAPDCDALLKKTGSVNVEGYSYCLDHAHAATQMHINLVRSSQRR